jgi:cobalt/nickel transport protein
MSKLNWSGSKSKWTVLAIVTIVLAVILSPFASPHPDGLERVAENQGFIEKAEGGFAWSPFPDYVVALPFSEVWQVAVAGAIGLIVMAVVLGVLGKYLANKRDTRV